VDFITKLLLVVEKDIILVVCNILSKIAHFVATTEDTMVDNIWTLHRLLESIISDKELQFAVKLTKELNNMLGIKTRLLIAFNPQIDRQTEYIN